MRKRNAERARMRGLLLFFILAFALAIPFWLKAPPLVGFAPAIAALIVGGPMLLVRAFDVHRLRDHVLALLLLPPALFASGALLMRFTAGTAPEIEPNVLLLFPVFFALALVQELGWTGYALERFPNRWAGVSAGMVLAAVWSVWSLVPLMQAGRPAHWVFYIAIAMMIFRVLMVWLYQNAGRSVVGAALLHAAWDASILAFPTAEPAYLLPFLAGALTLALLAQGPRLMPRSVKAHIPAHRGPARAPLRRARNLDRAAHRG
ncbi:MAG: hypothetical protein JNJ73_12080 [Hyphomonadaceae bacterium]|nr:hypothetical protein [Hyphomonadaceae bacterium]